jgi:hypothetical protein
VKIKKFKLHARIQWRNLKSFPQKKSLKLPTTKPKRKAHIFSPFGRKEKEKSKPAKSSQREKSILPSWDWEGCLNFQRTGQIPFLDYLDMTKCLE